MSERAQDYWSFFAGEARRIGAPLYVQFAEGIGGDEELREIASHVRKGQPPANILLGAVHFLLLRGMQHPLRRFYPNLNGGLRVERENAFPVFRDFVSSNRAAIEKLVAAKVTNTNEVGRSAHLHPAFRTVAAEAGEPLNLIEIGPSAGLNMIWDKFAVRYTRGTELFMTDAPPDALVIDCELRGENVPPLGPPPTVADRVGLERNPVDLSDSDQRDWLRALVWPDQIARFARLERALAIYEKEHPRIRAGDALDLLTDAIRAIPENQPVCVYHTYVTYQFSEEMREGLDAMLVTAGLRRPIWRISIEGTLQGDSPMLLYRYNDGQRDKRLLALCHPHGSWLEWKA